MKISYNKLLELKACNSGLERYLKQVDYSNDEFEVTSLIDNANIDDCVWLMSKILPHEKIVKFVCDCALINVELLKPCTCHYDLIEDFLENAHKFSKDTFDGYSYQIMRMVNDLQHPANLAHFDDRYVVIHAVYTVMHAVKVCRKYEIEHSTRNVCTYALTAGATQEQIKELAVKAFS